MINTIQQLKNTIDSLLLLQKDSVSQQSLSLVQQLILKLRNQLQQNNTLADKQVDQFLLKIPIFYESILKVIDFLFRMKKLSKIKLRSSKIIMYYFQVLNFITIYSFQNNKSIFMEQNFLKNIASLVDGLISNQQLFWPKTLKSFLIFMFNLIKNINKSQKKQKIMNLLQKYVLNLLKKSISFVFQTNKLNKQKDQLNKQQQLIEQNQIQNQKQKLQWLVYLIQSLFQLYRELPMKKQFIQEYFNFLNNHQHFLLHQYYLLHLIGNIFQKIIESRSTTELILKFQSPLDSVKQLYSKEDKTCSSLRISLEDYTFLLTLFEKYFNMYKISIKRIIIANQQSQLKTQYLEGIQDNIIELLRIFNCVLFLGGYNASIQQMAINELLQNEKCSLATFLQISYILYTQQQFLQKSKRKIQLVKVPESNLFALLNINKQTKIKIQNQLKLKQQICNKLVPGQLSSVLRLLTNLVHINQNAKKYFQDNIKHLHIILSLTHESQIQITMKQWAILFIKNCCQSQKIKNQINKVKINMKVQEQQ